MKFFWQLAERRFNSFKVGIHIIYLSFSKLSNSVPLLQIVIEIQTKETQKQHKRP